MERDEKEEDSGIVHKEITKNQKKLESKKGKSFKTTFV